MDLLIDIFLAFITCGTFCVLAQIILDNSKLTTGHVTSLFVVLDCFFKFKSSTREVQKVVFFSFSPFS